MGPSPDLPFALWRANLDLQLRIGQLIQDSSREWLELGTRAVGDGVVELDAEVRDLARGGDWQALAALPVETFWRQMEQRVGDGQALGQLAISVQDNFASGLVAALEAWQAEVAKALVGAAPAGARSSAWPAPFSPWSEWLQKSAAATTAGVADTAPSRPAPGKGDGRKRAPAKGSRKRGG